MEPTPEAIGLTELQASFYTPLELTECVNTVAQFVFIMMAVLLSVYPFLYILRKLIRYCETAFDVQVIKEMESGSMWSKMPIGSFYNSVDNISKSRLFEKARKGG